jgi:hypothetical protein
MTSNIRKNMRIGAKTAAVMTRAPRRVPIVNCLKWALPKLTTIDEKRGLTLLNIGSGVNYDNPDPSGRSPFKPRPSLVSNTSIFQEVAMLSSGIRRIRMVRLHRDLVS